MCRASKGRGGTPPPHWGSPAPVPLVHGWAPDSLLASLGAESGPPGATEPSAEPWEREGEEEGEAENSIVAITQTSTQTLPCHLQDSMSS